jgi:hypothetical protein
MSIIAVAMGMVVISVSTDDHRRDLRNQAADFQKLIALVIDEAIFQQKELGLKVYEDHISFLAFDEPSQSWQILSNTEDKRYKDYKFPPYIEVSLEMEDVELFLNPKDELERKISEIDPLENFEQFEEEEAPPEPDIYIFSSGEITSFSLEFRLRMGEAAKDLDTYSFTVSVDDIGNISCKAYHTDDESC